MADAVDVGRFTDRQAAVIDARLHPADVIAHDEEDVGFRLRSCRSRCRNRCQDATVRRIRERAPLPGDDGDRSDRTKVIDKLGDASIQMVLW